VGQKHLDFTEAGDSDWQWHQLGHMQVCTLLQTDNHASTPPLSFFTGRMPFLPPSQQHQSTEGMLHKFTTGEYRNTVCQPRCQNASRPVALATGVPHAMAQLALWLIRLCPEA